uniref:Intraflagellar transport protein 122 homolog n=1 Tax=Cacopsylla melanoneura TaxID=428564 RepID=A0A8D8X4M2_9HEMI
MLASCSTSDFTISTPDTKSLEKHKTESRINCCAWNSAGTCLAIGMANGTVTVRDIKCVEKLVVRAEGPSNTDHPVWALAWSPVNQNKEILCISDWGGKLMFYNITGHVVLPERNIKTELLTLMYYRDGYFLLGAGCNKSVSLWSSNGASQLVTLNSFDSWIWACVPSPDNCSILVGCQDATLTLYGVEFSPLYHVHREMVVSRVNLTEVRVSNVMSSSMVNIKCSDCVHAVFIYKNKLGVQMNDKVVVYEIYQAEITGMHARILKKIRHNLKAKLRGICATHFLMEEEDRLECYNFEGNMEREWHFPQAKISCVRVIDGVPGKECFLVAFHTGLVMKLFLHISFGSELLNAGKYITELHLNESGDQLACMTNTRLLYVYSLMKDTPQLYHEMYVDSVAWNSQAQDMFCYTSDSKLSIRTGTFPPHQQTLSGKVLCLMGSKLFVLKPLTYDIELIQIALSIPMYQYIENTLYTEAYSLACLGVTSEDWKCLAMAAAESFEFNVALKCFRKLQMLRPIDLISAHLSSPKKVDEREQCVLLGDLLALDGKFKEAAKLYMKGEQGHKAVTMYSDLRMFDLAQEYLGAESKNVDQKLLLKKKAEWAENINDPKTAAEMYLTAGAFDKVIGIYSQQGWDEKLVHLARQMAKTEITHLSSIAANLEALHKFDEAGEIYVKLGQQEKIIKLHAAAGKWSEALDLATGNLKAEIYLEHAQWLAERDQFLQAQQAFHNAGKTQESLKVLTQMIDNSINETRYQDTSYYYWLLANQYVSIDLAQSQLYNQLANIYYCYNIVHKYCQDPFTSYKPDVLFNVSRYALFEIKSIKSKRLLKGISQFSILHTLIKQAKLLGANKFANQMLEKLSKLYCTSANLRDTVDMSIMNMKAKEYHDEEHILIICYSCSTHIPLNSPVATCINCKQSFVYSFCTFEVLPLVEFQVRKSEGEVTNMKQSSEWTQEIEDNYQTLQIQSLGDPDPFIAMEGSGMVQVDEETLAQMEPGTVVICKWPSPLQYRYYRNLLPEFPVLSCESCFRMYHKEDFEMEKIQRGVCPFCRT